MTLKPNNQNSRKRFALQCSKYVTQCDAIPFSPDLMLDPLFGSTPQEELIRVNILQELINFVDEVWMFAKDNFNVGFQEIFQVVKNHNPSVQRFENFGSSFDRRLV